MWIFCDDVGGERVCDGLECVMALMGRGCVIFCDDVGGERVCDIL